MPTINRQIFVLSYHDQYKGQALLNLFFIVLFTLNQRCILLITPTLVGHLQGEQGLSYLTVISMPVLCLREQSKK